MLRTLGQVSRWHREAATMSSAAVAYLRPECDSKRIQAQNPRFLGTWPGP